jgi:branched-chain amino acid transport system substrate-binding protein
MLADRAQPANAADDEIVIGAAIALSGFVAPYDDGPQKAAQLAVKDINARGGVLGRQLKLVFADTKSDIAQGANAGLEVLDQGAQMVLVTCDYDFGAGAASVANARKIIAFSSCAADPKFGVQGIGPYAFTMSIGTPGQGALMAEWGYNEKGFRKAYMITDPTVNFDVSLCNAFKERWIEIAGEAAFLGEDTFQNSDPSIASQITRLKSLNPQPDFIMYCSYPPGGASGIKQLRDAGVEVPLLTGEGMGGNYWHDAVPGLSNFYYAMYGSEVGDDPRPEINDVLKRFVEMHGAQPATGQLYTGYAAIETWAKAVEKAGSLDGDAVRQVLESFRDEPTLVGATTYTPELHMSVTRPMVIMQVQNSKRSTIGVFRPTKAASIRF